MNTDLEKIFRELAKLLSELDSHCDGTPLDEDEMVEVNLLAKDTMDLIGKKIN